MSGRVHKSRRERAAADEWLSRNMSRIARATRPRGGRPLAFIPALVVEHAAKRYAVLRRWSDVLQELEREGNGTYARNTLIRRVARSTAVHNGPELELPRAARRRRRRPSKSPRSRH